MICCGTDHVWLDGNHGSYAIAVCDYCHENQDVSGEEAVNNFFTKHNHKDLPCPNFPAIRKK